MNSSANISWATTLNLAPLRHEPVANSQTNLTTSRIPQAPRVAHPEHVVLVHSASRGKGCSTFIDDKRVYCHTHGYTLRYYEDANYTENLYTKKTGQEQLSLRLPLMRTLLFSSTVDQLTYFDLDTMIVQHELPLDDVFAAEQAKHNYPCTVFIQADPLFANTGFMSVKNTAWVRHTFLPTWDMFQIESMKQGHFNNQPAFNLALLNLALEAHDIPSKPCWPEIDADLKLKIRAWLAANPDHPPEEYHILPKNTFYSAYAKGCASVNPQQKGARGKRLGCTKEDEHGCSDTDLFNNCIYLCVNYIFENILKLNFTERSFKVSDTDGVCYMGYDGIQLNRHHLIPQKSLHRVLDSLNPPYPPEKKDDCLKQMYSKRGAKSQCVKGLTPRHHAAQYGAAYSKDVFLIHHHLDLNFPDFCNRSVVPTLENGAGLPPALGAADGHTETWWS